MIQTVTRHAKRTMGVVALSAALLPLGASPSLAATMVSQAGSIGHYAFKDSASKPGAECTYEGAAGTQYFNGMKLRGPKVMYPDQNSSIVEHGKVGFVILLQRNTSGTWNTIVTSTETKISAHDNAWAKFPSKSQVFMGAATGGKWRAEVVLRWYKSGGIQIGSGTWIIDNYTRDYNGSVGSSCKARWSHLT